jgi:heme O synthase-like polyprenyltransferase
VTHASRILPAGHPARVAATDAGQRRSVKLVARSLLQLTKPRIIELLLVTTVPTMMLAQRGLPGARLLAVTLIGGTLAAACANTLNCYVDRDIDALMRRTCRRPLAGNGTSAVRPGEALASGIVLGVLATLLLGLLVNWLAGPHARHGVPPFGSVRSGARLIHVERHGHGTFNGFAVAASPPRSTRKPRSWCL